MSFNNPAACVECPRWTTFSDRPNLNFLTHWPSTLKVQKKSMYTSETIKNELKEDGRLENENNALGDEHETIPCVSIATNETADVINE